MATWPCPKCGRHGEINLEGAYYRAGGRSILCERCKSHFNYGITPAATPSQPSKPTTTELDPAVKGHYLAAADLLMAGATRLEIHRQLAGRGLGFAQAARVIADLEGYFSGTFTPAAGAAGAGVAVAVASTQAGDGVWGEVLAEFVFGFIQGVVEG